MQDESSKSTGPTCDDGTTCGPSRPSRSTSGDAIASSEAFPAKILPTADGRWASEDRGADYGRTCFASFANYDLDSSSWRTRQRCLNGDLETFSETWPPSGMTRSGRAYRRQPLGCFTVESDCSLWPTLLAHEGRLGYQKRYAKSGSCSQQSLTTFIRILEGRESEHGANLNPAWADWYMGFPVGYSDCDASATPSSPKSPNG